MKSFALYNGQSSQLAFPADLESVYCHAVYDNTFSISPKDMLPALLNPLCIELRSELLQPGRRKYNKEARDHIHQSSDTSFFTTYFAEYPQLEDTIARRTSHLTR